MCILIPERVFGDMGLYYGPGNYYGRVVGFSSFCGNYRKKKEGDDEMKKERREVGRGENYSQRTDCMRVTRGIEIS